MKFKFGKSRKDVDSNLYNVQFLYNVVPVEISKKIFSTVVMLIKMYTSSGVFSVSYFRSPYLDGCWTLRDQTSYKNMIIRVSSLNRLMYDRHGEDLINQACWKLYEDHSTSEACGANAFYVAFCGMWSVYFGGLRFEDPEFQRLQKIVLKWVEESVDMAIEQIDFDYAINFDKQIYNPNNLPDLTRQNKVLDHLMHRVVHPLMWADPEYRNRPIPF